MIKFLLSSQNLNFLKSKSLKNLLFSSSGYKLYKKTLNINLYGLQY